MRIAIYFLAGISCFCMACKKGGADEPAYLKTFTFNIKNHGLSLALKRVHYLTDSLFFEFATGSLYNCDKYRINTAEQANARAVTLTMGNIYQEGGQCIYGTYPAIFRYQSARLPAGQYRIVVKKNDIDYTGTLTVDENGYQFNWLYDDAVLKIEPKHYP